MNLSLVSDDEKLFLSRLKDLFTMSRAKYKTAFSKFLDERQVLLANEYIKQNKLDNYLLYGGRENAERLMLGVFSPHMNPDAGDFPITHITSRFPEKSGLTHRDFLGTLMSLGIARDSIGDILVSVGRCDFFTIGTVSNTILTELVKVGGFGVKTAKGAPGDFIVLERFEQLRITVSSPRLDSLVSHLTNVSREKASALIKQGLVRHNFVDLDSVSRSFAAGDTVSIRGYGKYIVDEIGAPTKKGRLPVICRKYS